MKHVRLILAGLVVAVSFSTLSPPSPAQALSGSDFQAGRIIDDAVFYDNTSMTTAEVQAFLDAKVPACDTDGTQPYAGTTAAAYGTLRGFPPPYTCLKDYSQLTTDRPGQAGLCAEHSGGNQSAAEIIKAVADACGINPQVLLVIIQKEQGLITDTWPWSTQYQRATGFGCPDSPSCDPQYEGFFNQVYSAARQFKYYALHPDFFNFQANRNNSIKYNADPTCGSSTVFIENQATASLYNYTPYQPNTASLSSLYGVGNNCSSYGNRNFWRYFNDWFGPTTNPTPAPTAHISVNGQMVATAPYDSTVQVAWTSEHTTNCGIYGGGINEASAGTNGQITLAHVKMSQAYELVCAGPSGTTNQSAILTVLPPTFSYIQSQLTTLQSLSSAKGLGKQLESAEKFYSKGDTDKAMKSLAQIKDDLGKLLSTGKLPSDQVQPIIQSIDGLLASWN